jgi:DNA-directed RNA polymerase sigma subunit (sigma70/sigma32)
LTKIWTREDVEEALLLMQDTLSLNAPINEDDRGNETELEFLLEDPGPSVEELVLRKESGKRLREYMAEYLKPREIEVLEKRYGFDGQPIMTLEEIGREKKMTRERVRQIEERAIRRLRLVFACKNITLEDI